MSYPPIRNANERSVAVQLSDQGYKVLNRGWPDFLAVRGEEVRFIEVKPTCRHQLDVQQRLMADQLRKIGVQVELAAAMCVCGGDCQTPLAYSEGVDLRRRPPRSDVHDGRHRNCVVCHPPKNENARGRTHR